MNQKEFNRASLRAFFWLVLPAMAGCAQFTTSAEERSQLQSAADAAGKAYLDCLGNEAGRYVGTSEDTPAIVSIARKNCAAARDAAGRAQSELQTTSYIMSEREAEAQLAELDRQGETAISELVLTRRTGVPPAAAAMPATVPAMAAPPATGPTLITPAPVDGTDEYLSCMRVQASRWANVDEPATIIADAAHGRCASQLKGTSGRNEAERQGRSLVVGIVLDRKAQASSAPKP